MDNTTKKEYLDRYNVIYEESMKTEQFGLAIAALESKSSFEADIALQNSKLRDEPVPC